MTRGKLVAVAALIAAASIGASWNVLAGSTHGPLPSGAAKADGPPSSSTGSPTHGPLPNGNNKPAGGPSGSSSPTKGSPTKGNPTKGNPGGDGGRPGAPTGNGGRPGT